MSQHEHVPYLTKRGAFCTVCDRRMVTHAEDPDSIDGSMDDGVLVTRSKCVCGAPWDPTDGCEA